MRILSLLILSLVFIGYELTKDYCFEKHRKLTDKEYIMIILEKLLKENKIQVHEWDNTAITYLHHHPKCCRVFRDKLSSYEDAPEVEIYYELSNKMKEQYHARYYDSVTWLSTCGKPFKFTGLAEDTIINKTLHK